MTKKLNHKYLYLFLTLGLLLEFPIRYLLSPDPWLAAPDSWYFAQPLRLLIEFIFVVLAISPILIIKEFRKKIILNLNKGKLLFIIIGSFVSILIFTFLEQGQLQNILSTASLSQIVIWSLTGFFIGFGQEVTFRGLIYTGLRKKFNFITTNFITTIIFILGTIHSVRLLDYILGGEITDAIVLIVIYFFMGLFFGWVREDQKSVLVPAIIHGFGNAVTWLAVFALF